MPTGEVQAIKYKMAIKLTPHLITLTYEAALKSFWRKPALKKFLLSSHISQSFLSSWTTDESKRVFLDRTFEKLQMTDKGKSIICQMALALSEQTTFPDLEGWEDSVQKKTSARKSVSELLAYLNKQRTEIAAEKATADYIKMAREDNANIQRSITDKKKLEDELNALAKYIGSQKAGYDFQDWFYKMLDYCEITSRGPYTSNGRQIDGSMTIEGTTYLVELKFTKEQAGAQDIDIFRSKIDSKADNTMGVMVSMSGYSTTAISVASGRKTTLLLFDYQHLFHFLTGHMNFEEIVLRVRRHAAQTGEAHLPISRFS